MDVGEYVWGPPPGDGDGGGDGGASEGGEAAAGPRHPSAPVGAVDVSNSARELLACLSLNAACPQYAASTFDRLGLEVHPEDEALSVRASAALEESRERWPKSFSA